MGGIFSLIQVFFLCAILVLFFSYIHAYLSSPLRKIPGPFLAKFSDWWRVWNHFWEIQTEKLKALHQKHGKVVRVGPNTVSFNDPDLVKTIYSIRGNFVKVCDSRFLHGRI
jgi:hypothetical protein